MGSGRGLLEQPLRRGHGTLNEVFVFWPAGAISTIAAPMGLGSCGSNGRCFGQRTCLRQGFDRQHCSRSRFEWDVDLASAITIERSHVQPLDVVGLAGDLYVPSAMRQSSLRGATLSGIDQLGTVSDGVTNAATVYLMNAGNPRQPWAPRTLPSQQTPCSLCCRRRRNGCSSGTHQVLPGLLANLRAPLPRRPRLPTGQTGTATINVTSPPAATFNVNMSGYCHACRRFWRRPLPASHPPDFVADRPADHAVGHGRRLRKSGRLHIDPLDCPTCATITAPS